MNILVCVKQVLESGSPVRIDENGTGFQFSGNSRFELNPYDAYAVETAVRIKETFPDTIIDAITAGPERSVDVLRRALGMGADEGIHILDNTGAYRPPAVTAAWIAQVAAKKGYDLILTGIMSDDEMNSQTAPLIAGMLKRPCITSVMSLELDQDNGTCIVDREIEGGAKDRYQVQMPCILAIQTGINSPRYPSLSKVLRARKKTFETIPGSSLDTLPGQTTLHCFKEPVKEMQGIFLEGDAIEKAEQLTEILSSRTLF